mmetsp:Transcript_21439/g.54005  ORF Transcript_21439/g.54005 Transcript_21439/m.54005 type:complete len:253 (+) Transcript_21439:1066-1824(+)
MRAVCSPSSSLRRSCTCITLSFFSLSWAVFFSRSTCLLAMAVSMSDLMLSTEALHLTVGVCGGELVSRLALASSTRWLNLETFSRRAVSSASRRPSASAILSASFWAVSCEAASNSHLRRCAVVTRSLKPCALALLSSVMVLCLSSAAASLDRIASFWGVTSVPVFFWLRFSSMRRCLSLIFSRRAVSSALRRSSASWSFASTSCALRAACSCSSSVFLCWISRILSLFWRRRSCCCSRRVCFCVDAFSSPW